MYSFELVDDKGVVQNSCIADRPEYRQINGVEYVFFYRWDSAEMRREYVAGPIPKPESWSVRAVQ